MKKQATGTRTHSRARTQARKAASGPRRRKTGAKRPPPQSPSVPSTDGAMADDDVATVRGEQHGIIEDAESAPERRESTDVQRE